MATGVRVLSCQNCPVCDNVGTLVFLDCGFQSGELFWPADLVASPDVGIQTDWPKTLRSHDKRTKRTSVLCPCPGTDLARSCLGLRLTPLKGQGFHPENMAFPPEETGIISPKATVCLGSNALEIFCIPFV